MSTQPQFQPYFSQEINEWITTPAIDNVYRTILAADQAHLDFYVTDYNTQIDLNPEFPQYQGAVVMKKSIYYRRRELKRIALEEQTRREQEVPLFDPFAAIAGIFGSAAIGSFIGNKLASSTRAGADLDEVNRILGK